jgi:hypothetical protein
VSPFQKWLAEHHPRVKHLKAGTRCEAIKSGAPLKAYWKRDGTRQDDQALIEKWRCKATAHWRFTYLKGWPSQGRTARLCFSHLWYRGVFGDMRETEATERQMVKTGYASPEQTITQPKGKP